MRQPAQPLGARFEHLPKEWAARLWECNRLFPTGKTTCTMYLSTLDRYFHLDSGLVQELIEQAAEREGRSPSDVVRDIRQAIESVRRRTRNQGQEEIGSAHVSESESSERRGKASWTANKEHLYTRFLQNLFPRILGVLAGDKLRLSGSDDDLDVLDFLADLFEKRARNVSVGGAAAHMAELLTIDCNEPDVVLWTRFHSKEQADAFGPRTKFLDLGPQTLHSRPAYECGRTGDPDVRNYPFEFTEHPASYSDLLMQPPTPGRVIVIAPGYLYYQPNGHVDRVRSQGVPSIRHLLSDSQDRSRIEEVGERWKHWIIINLQRVTEPSAQESLEADLQSIPTDVTVHVEISGSDISPWFKSVIRRSVDSVGINIDELMPAVSDMPDKRQWTPPLGTPPATTLDHAAWLASELDLERVYVHGRELDIILRGDAGAVDPSTLAQTMSREVTAGLYAKAEVVRQAGKQQFPDLGTKIFDQMIQLFLERGLKSETAGFLTYDETSFYQVFRSGVFPFLYRNGEMEKAYSVAMVPVAWMAKPPATVWTTGLGDKTSVISFIYGYCKTTPSKRSPHDG